MNREGASAGGQAEVPAARRMRHARVDRWFHWLTAAAVLVLMGTAFLPILGLQFAWVTIHWIAGLVLAAAVLLHTVRALFWQSLRSMWIGARDLRDWVHLLRWSWGRSDRPPPKPGKYSLAQKLAHHAFSVLVLAAIVTGGLMLVKIDTPWWDRDPYWLPDRVWGLVYVVHDLAALSLITMVMVHIYFALRPEKRVFLRSMWRGWITQREYHAYHDPERWGEKHD
jgi:formate dehydrogenase subunit gamma